MSRELPLQEIFRPLSEPAAAAPAGTDTHLWLAGLLPGAYALPKPRRALQPLHDPAYVERWLRAIVAALVQPVETATVGKWRCVQVLGQAIFVRDEEGAWGCWLWEDVDGRMNLYACPPAQIVADGVPHGWFWLGRFERQFFAELARRHPGQRARVRAYAGWVFECFRARLRRGHLVRHARRRVAEALALDPSIIALARRCAFHVIPKTPIRLGDYNHALLHRPALERIAVEAPRLLTPYFTLCEYLTGAREPVAALRRAYLASGISPATWRLLHQQGVRKLRPLLEFYSCATREALVDMVRIVDALGATSMPPTWFLRSILYRFGNFGQRRESYLLQLAPMLPALRRLTALVERAGSAEMAAMKTWLYPVVSWLNEDRNAAHHPHARKAGWRWYERKAAEWQEQQGERARGSQGTWPAPFSVLELEQHQVVPLRNRFELWQEGRKMRHCVAQLDRHCDSGETLILSIRRADRERPVATLRLQRDEGRWKVAQVTGCANTVPAPHVVRIAFRTAHHVSRMCWGLPQPAGQAVTPDPAAGADRAVTR